MQNGIKRVAKVLFTVAIVTIGFSLGSCAQHKGWSETQRKEARKMLHQWRDLVYLRNMNDVEFAIFSDGVADILEEQYPSYIEFVEMPQVGDSVEVVVLAAIVADIKADAKNMRHIFPYHELVRQEILPKGLDEAQKKEFYNCFAQKVNTFYGSVQVFVWDAVNSTLDDMVTARMLRQCAAPYWEVVDVTIVEEWGD